jgi:hypothetical protein
VAVSYENHSAVQDMRDVVAFTTDGILLARVKPRSLWKKEYKESHQGTYVRIRTNDIVLPPKGQRISDVNIHGKQRVSSGHQHGDGTSSARIVRKNGSYNNKTTTQPRRLSPLRTKSSAATSSKENMNKKGATVAASPNEEMSAADVLALLNGPSMRSAPSPSVIVQAPPPEPVPYSTALSLPPSLPIGHPLAFAARGWRFYAGVDSPGGSDEPSLPNLANDVLALMDEADRRPGIVAFHTRGTFKKSLALKRDWIRPVSPSTSAATTSTVAASSTTTTTATSTTTTPTPTTSLTISPPPTVASVPSSSSLLSITNNGGTDSHPPSPRNNKAPVAPAIIEHGLYVRLTLIQPRPPIVPVAASSTSLSRQLSSPDDLRSTSSSPNPGSPQPHVHVPPPIIASAIPSDIGLVAPTSPSRRRRLLFAESSSDSKQRSSPRSPQPPSSSSSASNNSNTSSVLLSPATVAHALANSPLSRRGVRPKLQTHHKYAQLRLTRTNIIASNNDFVHFDPIDLGPSPRDFAIHLLSRPSDLNTDPNTIKVYAVDHASLVTSNLTPELHFRYTAGKSRFASLSSSNGIECRVSIK